MWALLDNEGRKGASAAKFISGLSIISLFVFIPCPRKRIQRVQ